MNGFLAKLGSKGVALLTLIISCVAVVSGLLWQQQTVGGNSHIQHEQQQQQIAVMIHKAMSARVALLRQQMTSIATSPDLARIIVNSDNNQISSKQAILTTLLPSAQKVCLIAADVDQPDENACLPISFASLNSLRLAKEKGSAPMALMQVGKSNEHLLLAQRIMDSEDNVAGVLVVALNPTVMTDLLLSEYGAMGYVELRQGIKQTKIVAKQGNITWRQGASKFDKAIEGSHWRILYWPAEAVGSTSISKTLLLVVLAVMLLMWLLRAFLNTYLFKKDIVILKGQILDIKESKLKPHYSLINTALQEVADDLKVLALETAHSVNKVSSEAPSTADRINSSLKQNKGDNIPEETILDSIDEPDEKKIKPQPENEAVTKHLDASEETVAELSFTEPKKEDDVLEPEIEEKIIDLVPLEFSIAAPEEEPKKEKVVDKATPLELNIDEPLILSTDESPTLDLALEQSDAVSPSIFKAYDIRGIVDQTLNDNTVRKIGQAIGSEAQEKGITKLVVGRDGRHSSPSFSNALIEGILSTGCAVTDIGMVPTPVLYFACHQLKTQSGVMVTGSHNPANYNGLKILLAEKSLSGDAIQALYQRIEQNNFSTGRGTKTKTNVIDDYINRIIGDVRISHSIKVVIDCGNGVAGVVAPKLLAALGCDVVELYSDVDGDFPNHHPDPSKPENLQALIAKVKESGADLGIAFDGDGDRLGVVDVNGKAIWPDRLMTLFSQDILSREQGATIIYDVKSTSLLEGTIKDAGGKPLMWKSGHSLIKNKMQETGAQLAGEMSGHIFFKERWYGFDDGLYAAVRLLEILSKDPLSRSPTDVFSSITDRINTPEIMIEMNDDESHRLIEQLSNVQFEGATVIKIDGIRAEYKTGWGLVRASNTMPGITLRFEAESEEGLQKIQQQFKQQILQIKPTLTLLF